MSKVANSGRDVTELTVRLATLQYEAMTRAAERDDRSKASWIRHAINEKLAREAVAA